MMYRDVSLAISKGHGPHWISGPVRAAAPTEPVVFGKLLLNCASYDTKIGSFNFFELKNINFNICYVQVH